MVLIPKVEQPSTLRDLRPITLCNVAFKVITKVLVNRLQPFSCNLIGPMQNNFIPGRGTMDNAFLAQEVIHHMSKSTAKKRSVAFKIDLEKAYDNVSWIFLRETLKFYGFPEVTINLIMSCVTSSQVFILWNGSRLLAFKPGRGLKQGDPMSPYLFVLCMERLLVLIQSLVDKGEWKPILLSKHGPPISYFSTRMMCYFFARR